MKEANLLRKLKEKKALQIKIHSVIYSVTGT